MVDHRPQNQEMGASEQIASQVEVIFKADGDEFGKELLDIQSDEQNKEPEKVHEDQDKISAILVIEGLHGKKDISEIQLDHNLAADFPAGDLTELFEIDDPRRVVCVSGVSINVQEHMDDNDRPSQPNEDSQIDNFNV